MIAPVDVRPHVGHVVFRPGFKLLTGVGSIAALRPCLDDVLVCSCALAPIMLRLQLPRWEFSLHNEPFNSNINHKMLTLLYLSSYCSVQQRLLQFRSDAPQAAVTADRKQPPLVATRNLCSLEALYFVFCFCFFLDLEIDFFFVLFYWNSHTY